MSLVEKLYNKNKKQIDEVNNKVNRLKDSKTSGFTYGFVSSTLSEAQATTTTIFTLRFITDARKSGEGVGNGTGLPAFYDPDSSTWVDFSGVAITV